MLETITQTKKCCKCQETKETSFFSKHKRTKDGLQKICKLCAKEYRQSKIEENRAYSKNYHHKNKEIFKESRKKYFETYRLNNKEVIAERVKKSMLLKKEYYRLSSLERAKKYYLKNRKKVLDYSKKYKKSEKGSIVAKNSNNKRRALLKTGDVDTNKLLKLQENAKVCYWCNCSLKKVKVHIDHYIPLSKGGEHTLSNLVVSCGACNMKKHSKDPLEFAQTIGKLL